MHIKSKIASIYKPPLVIIVVTVVVLFVKFLPAVNFRGAKTSGKANNNVTSKILGPKVPADWKEYNNTKYRFVVYIPPLLLRRPVESNGRYLEFVKFEENRYSSNKGLALGITDRTLEEEVEVVKDQLNMFSTSDSLTGKIKVDGKEAVRLEYDGGGNLEPRSVVIVGSEGVTLSVSTTPEQVESVINSIDFY